jgi:hypothetical protein
MQSQSIIDIFFSSPSILTRDSHSRQELLIRRNEEYVIGILQARPPPPETEAETANETETELSAIDCKE